MVVFYHYVFYAGAVLMSFAIVSGIEKSFAPEILTTAIIGGLMMLGAIIGSRRK